MSNPISDTQKKLDSLERDSNYIMFKRSKSIYRTTKELAKKHGGASRALDRMIKLKTNDKNTVLPEGVEKYCKHTETFLPLSDFVFNQNWPVPGFSVTRIYKNRATMNMRNAYREGNMEIIRLWFNGDTKKPLHCAVTGENIEESEEIFNPYYNRSKNCRLYELHHILTVAGQSVHKAKATFHPNKILSQKDLSKPANISFLIEVMNCIAVSQDEHKKVHVWDNSDIEYWVSAGATLPWGLQNAKNFNKFCRAYNITNLNYKDFYKKQTLKWYDATIRNS